MHIHCFKLSIVTLNADVFVCIQFQTQYLTTREWNRVEIENFAQHFQILLYEE